MRGLMVAGVLVASLIGGLAWWRVGQVESNKACRTASQLFLEVDAEIYNDWADPRFEPVLAAAGRYAAFDTPPCKELAGLAARIRDGRSERARTLAASRDANRREAEERLSRRDAGAPGGPPVTVVVQLPPQQPAPVPVRPPEEKPSPAALRDRCLQACGDVSQRCVQACQGADFAACANLRRQDTQVCQARQQSACTAACGSELARCEVQCR